jgi:hypothetical protein
MADVMENLAPEALVVAIADVHRGSYWLPQDSVAVA